MAHQTLWGLTLLTLLLLLEQTNSEVYESWNYGRNQLIRDMKETMDKINDRLDGMDNSLKDIKKEIHYIRNFSNIPLTHEERLANLSCPTYFLPINTTIECILIANTYSTYKEATDSCASLGAHLFVPKDKRLLGDFLMKIGLPSTHSRMRTFLSHDIFWIGADNKEKTEMMRWVDGKPVDVPILVYSTEPGGMTAVNPDTNLCGVLRLDELGGDDESGDNKLTATRCEEPQRYPYLCEIDSGSEPIRPEFPIFQEICSDRCYQALTGECMCRHYEFLNYSEAVNFCAEKGQTLIHPRNLTYLIDDIKNDISNIEYNPNHPQFPPEHGIWLSNTVTSIDPDWNDMMEMEKSKQQENDEPGTDMCTLLKVRPSKIQVNKEIASCSSSQTFLCSLNMHPKAYNMFGPGPYG